MYHAVLCAQCPTDTQHLYWTRHVEGMLLLSATVLLHLAVIVDTVLLSRHIRQLVLTSLEAGFNQVLPCGEAASMV